MIIDGKAVVLHDGRTPGVEEEHFIKTLFANNQVGKREANGKLPSGATHELIEDNGQLRLKRVRFGGFNPHGLDEDLT